LGEFGSSAFVPIKREYRSTENAKREMRMAVLKMKARFRELSKRKKSGFLSRQIALN
jgi:hypothetical protein